MTSQPYSIKTMTRGELDLAVDWAAAEGWNPGLHDADAYYAADPNGFLIGYLGDEPIACISVVKYGESFGFLGFYIVKEQYRGQGYGLKIWQAGVRYLEGRTMGLDGVVEQQANYAKSGFELAYRNVRYEGKGGGEGADTGGVVELGSLQFDQVAAYDSAFFPEDRSGFIKAWIQQPESTALGVVDGEALVGYGVIRRCRSGYKIGPLFADSPEVAQTLFLALRSRAGVSDPVFLDVPEVNAEAVALAESHGMSVVFETARMYAGDAPAISVDRTYGVTSFEIG